MLKGSNYTFGRYQKRLHKAFKKLVDPTKLRIKLHLAGTTRTGSNLIKINHQKNHRMVTFLMVDRLLPHWNQLLRELLEWQELNNALCIN
jgi:hypothetical protein